MAETYDELYSEYWTKEQAEYVAYDLPNYISEIAWLFGLDTTITQALTGTVADLLNSLYTTSTIDSLLEMIQPLVVQYTQDDETIAMIVDIVVSMGLVDDVDVGAIINHLTTFTYEAFEDGDRDAFAQVIVDFIEPLVPVLDLFLISSQTQEGTLSVYGDTIAVNSYDGYTSAILPLLEALGCDSDTMLTYDEFVASSDEEKVYAIINPIFGLLDNYFANTDNEFAIYSILQIVPNILYFVETGGLNSVLENLIRPIYAVLDTVRPIYNLNLTIDFDVYGLVDTLINDMIADANIENYVQLSIDFSQMITDLMQFGYTVEKTSVTGETYNYFVFYEQSYAEIITIVLLEVVDDLVFGKDIQQYIDLLAAIGTILDDQQIGQLLVDLGEMESSDQVLLAIYYLVYGVQVGTDAYDILTDAMLNFFTDFLNYDSSVYSEVIDRTIALLDEIAKLFEDWENAGDGESTVQPTLNWFESLLLSIQEFFAKMFSWLNF